MDNQPNCGGEEFKIIAALFERSVIEKIPSHLGLDPQPPQLEVDKAPIRTYSAGGPAVGDCGQVSFGDTKEHNAIWRPPRHGNVG